MFNQDISGWDVLNVTNYIDYGSGSGHSNSNFTSSNLYRYFRYIFDDSTLQSAIDLHYDTETIQATFGNNYWGAPTRNGPIQLYKGKTYIFDWSNVDHSYAGGPFKIYTTNPSGELTENVIIDTNAETTTLTVTETTPTQLKYGGGGWGSPPNGTVTIIDLEDVYGPINNWGVSNVTNMNELFKDKTTFNDNISGWDVSNVTSMNNMFNSATSFNKPLGSNSYVNLDPVFVAIGRSCNIQRRIISFFRH